MLMRHRAVFWFVLTSTLSATVAGFGQTERATLTGRISDPQGRIVPGASVQVTNIDTGIETTTTTNNDGLYVVPSLLPGRYRMIVHKDGFKEIVKPDIALHVQDNVALNFSLEVGSITQSVTVAGGAPLVNTESAAVSTVVDRQFVENLPLNGRSFQTLINLTPGIVLPQADSFNPGQFSVNGQRANANYFMIDGVSANIGSSTFILGGQSAAGSIPGYNISGGTNSLASQDAVQEFKILTSTYAAEFGRTPGAQVVIETRSGTNKFTGTLFEYFRNDVLDANDWFNNFHGLPKTALRQNDFGGVFGGPIVKDRTFIFVSYEGTRLRLPQILTSDVPSLTLRQAAPAAVQPILNAFPISKGPDGVDPITGQPTGFAEFTGAFSTPTTADAFSIRIDHTVRKNLTFFGRYNYAPSNTAERGVGSFALSNVSKETNTTHTLTAGATLILTPNISNDLRANYSRNSGTFLSEQDDFGGAVSPPDSFWFPPSISKGEASSAIFLFSLLTEARHTLIGVGKDAAPLQRQFNIVDGLSVMRGGHQLKLGVDYRRLSPVIDFGTYSRFFNMSTDDALASTTQFDFIEAFVGPLNPIFHNLSLYAQDTWRVRQRLTLTYGLRWELNPPPSEKKDPLALAGFDAQGNPLLAPRGAPLWKTTYNNFAPRIGLVYQLSTRSGLETMLRGGFGIFYDLGNTSAANAFGFYPFSATKLVLTSPFPLPPDVEAPPPLGGPPTAADSLAVADPNLKMPFTYQWNVTLEQSLGKDQKISASYVAAVGRRLLRQDTPQSPTPEIPEFVYLTRNGATSDYHALQVQFQRRLSRGLQALASYTWAHSIDIASEDNQFIVNPAGNRIPARFDRGPSNFDVRHTFSGAVTYDLPKPSAGKVGSAILGNWSADTILIARSAAPVNVTYDAFGSFGFVELRPDLIPGVPLYIHDSSLPGGKRINPDAFSISSADRQGTLGRNALRGFGAWQADFAVHRRFNLTEHLNLQFRAEFFNVFNHANFGDPGVNQGIETGGSGNSSLGFFDGTTLFPNPSFGVSSATLARTLGGVVGGGFSSLYQIGGPRSIQLALRLSF